MNFTKEDAIKILESIDFNKIKKHPNILIAANFWEEDRFYAAKVCYKYMRAIDDLVDEHKAKNEIIAIEEQEKFKGNVEGWLNMLTTSDNDKLLNQDLIEVINKFIIPAWPMEYFAKSMIYDIYNDGFPTLQSFIDYSQGASVAPASIFVHLNGLINNNGSYLSPAFDVKEAATPCAMFSYFVHIIRDFQKDQLENLNYFADDMLKKFNLTRQMLRDFAEGTPVNYDYRKMVKEYYDMADKYRLMTYEVMKKIKPLLETRYQLSLEIIFNLYQLVFEKIDIENGSLMSDELCPNPDETRESVFATINKFM